MPDFSSAVPQARPVARPVDATERVALLDALRGFALCGVFVANSYVWFSGRILLPREQAQALSAPPLEVAVGVLFQFFVNQKFMTLFAFLFGLGFSLLLARAEARASNPVPLYSRRLGVMLGLGLAHLFGLWQGDILATYAVLGFALLLFRRRSDRAVLLWAAGLLVAVPLVVPVLHRFGPVLLHGAEAAAAMAKESSALEARQRAELLAGLASDSFRASQAANARYFVETFWEASLLTWLCGILGRFLLGLLAGRHRLLLDVDGHRAWHHRLLGWGLAVGVLGNGAAVVMQRLRVAGLVDPVRDAWTVLLTPVLELGHVGLAAAYVAGFALLFQREGWRRALGVLAPVGRMALTNYLLQTGVSLCLYDGWGLGLIGRLPPSRCVALALALFAVQVVFSHAWLGRFRFGPAEWLWRSLTYGRAQPMRLSPRAAPASAPP